MFMICLSWWNDSPLVKIPAPGLGFAGAAGLQVQTIFMFRVVDKDLCWLKKLLLVSAIGKKPNLRAQILIMILLSGLLSIQYFGVHHFEPKPNSQMNMGTYEAIFLELN